MQNNYLIAFLLIALGALLLHSNKANSAPVEYTASEFCLASAIMTESDGESLEGQLSVANVIFTRVKSHRWPNTICSVVNQPRQFDGINYLDQYPQHRFAYHLQLAKDILEGDLNHIKLSLPSKSADHYHKIGHEPYWKDDDKIVHIVGLHIFYKGI